MALHLSPASETYVADNHQKTRMAIGRELDRSLKRNTDLEFIDNRIILRSPDGSRWALSASDAGALAATAL